MCIGAMDGLSAIKVYATRYPLLNNWLSMSKFKIAFVAIRMNRIIFIKIVCIRMYFRHSNCRDMVDGLGAEAI